MKRRNLLSMPPLSLLATALSAPAGALGIGRAALAQDSEVVPFDRAWLIEHARQLAEQAYEPPAFDVADEFSELSYDQYRGIRFREEHRVWADDGLPFTLDPLPAGFIYRVPVRLFLVEEGSAVPLKPHPEMFEFGQGLQPQEGATLPFSGIRARFPINRPDVQDEFLVIQGASYFRAVAAQQVYGLSARGLAIKTGDPEGEEFPAFTALWIERPPADSRVLVVHALLDSPSCTGAYRLTMRPGAETVIDVELVLFARQNLERVGLAPLTSMYLFGSANRAGFDDFRDAVHDSDGLQILTGGGERIWRPLTNPRELQISAFADRGPLGFGLLQRERRFEEYEDLEARYDKRPSVWIESVGDWGEGQFELVEIPSTREANDNIVAFWRPKQPIATGGPWPLAYRMRWTGQPMFGDNLAEVRATRSGGVPDSSRRQFVIDFTLAPLREVGGLTLDVGASAGSIADQSLTPVPEQDLLRAAFRLDPGDEELIELRAVLRAGDRKMSETWLYRWAAT
ncbi:MAG: glucan biosynthesis protein G [Alphaproteobacteria bacterium]